jgi:hypothetical protein
MEKKVIEEEIFQESNKSCEGSDTHPWCLQFVVPSFFDEVLIYPSF